MTQLNYYINRLMNHDWFYMYADRLLDFERGQQQWLEIASLRKKLDPDYTIFNQHAPEQMQIKPESTGAKQ